MILARRLSSDSDDQSYLRFNRFEFEKYETRYDFAFYSLISSLRFNPVFYKSWQTRGGDLKQNLVKINIIQFVRRQIAYYSSVIDIPWTLT